MGAPYKQEELPYWVDPCGTMHLASADQTSSEAISPKSMLSVLQAINITTRNALTHAQQFNREFVWETFGVSFDTHHNDWKQTLFEWLSTKEIPKTLGNKVPESHFELTEEDEDLSSKLDNLLVKLYKYLQTLAVGLEQVNWDMEKRSDKDAKFKKHFRGVQLKLRLVLCEMYLAIVGRRLSWDDVERSVMSDEYRVIINNTSYMNLRDWIIFREYMNCLEYIIEFSEYFIEAIRSEKFLSR